MHIAVYGGGKWGTALALAMSRTKNGVSLYIRNPNVAAEAAVTRINQGFHLDPRIFVTSDIEMMRKADIILIAVPAQEMGNAAAALAPFVRDGVIAVPCAKGIEALTHRIMPQIIEDRLPEARCAILSGPGFAADVADGQKATAVTIAAGERELAIQLMNTLSSRRLRLYASDDPSGVAFGGALKNVEAIAAGMVEGRDLGESAWASITTRGLEEMVRLGMACGAKSPQTFRGLSGLGDLILSCRSNKSRNYRLGYALGSGVPFEEAVLAEGFYTAPVAIEMAAKAGVDMPIAQLVNAILQKKLTVDEAIDRALSRPYRFEMDDF